MINSGRLFIAPCAKCLDKIEVILKKGRAPQRIYKAREQPSEQPEQRQQKWPDDYSSQQRRDRKYQKKGALLKVLPGIEPGLPE
jgi:hypothetical protein